MSKPPAPENKLRTLTFIDSDIFLDRTLPNTSGHPGVYTSIPSSEQLSINDFEQSLFSSNVPIEWWNICPNKNVNTRSKTSILKFGEKTMRCDCIVLRCPSDVVRVHVLEAMVEYRANALLDDGTIILRILHQNWIGVLPRHSLPSATESSHPCPSR